MCNKIFNPRLAPLKKNHLDFLINKFPQHEGFISSTYNALTENLSPQVNLLVMFTLLKELKEKASEGVLRSYDLLYVPLSIVAKTTEGEWTRFRPKAVNELHTSFLSFMMAETNRNKLNDVFGRYDLSFAQGHCCGVLFGSIENVKKYQGSKLYVNRNWLRSHLESVGMPVEDKMAISDIPEQNIDLRESERSFFEQYENVFKEMKLAQSREECIEMNKLNSTWHAILKKTPDSPKKLHEEMENVMPQFIASPAY